MRTVSELNWYVSPKVRQATIICPSKPYAYNWNQRYSVTAACQTRAKPSRTKNIILYHRQMSALPTQRPFCYAILTRFRTRMSQRNCHKQLFWSYMNLLSFAIFVEYLRNCFRQIESVKTAAKVSRNRESCMVSWPCHCLWKSLFKLTKVVWGHCIIILESCYTIATLDTDCCKKFLSSQWTITITTPIIGHILFSVFVIFHLLY